MKASTRVSGIVESGPAAPTKQTNSTSTTPSAAGRPADHAERMPAVLPVRVSSERGRTEFLLVSLVRGADGSSLTAYPAGKGSGAVTAFSQADGFITIEGESLYRVPPLEIFSILPP
jgi:hypothetical protein